MTQSRIPTGAPEATAEQARLQVELNRAVLDRAEELLSKAAQQRRVVVVSGLDSPADQTRK